MLPEVHPTQFTHRYVSAELSSNASMRLVSCRMLFFWNTVFSFFLCDREKRFEKPPVLIAHFGGEEILQAYLMQKNKLLHLKGMDLMGLQNVRGFVHRSARILTVLESKIRSLHKTCRIQLKQYFADNQ